MKPSFGITAGVATGVLVAATAGAADEPVTEPGARLEKLAGGFTFTEGATCDPDGNVFFTDQPSDRILCWSTEGKLTTFMQPAGRSNGLIFDPRGNLLACADEKNELWLIDGHKTITVLVREYEGKLLNGPNDVWLAPGGELYFTDPFYKRPYWKRTASEQSVQGVYLVSADRKRVTRVIDDLKQPNGITGTPDGRTLYVADIGAGQTYAYDLDKDGRPTNKRLFCESGSDGATLDAEGNVYLTGKGVLVFDKTGRKIQTIEVPENWVGNVCFGGKDRRTLFITASKGLYAIRMRVQGVNARGGK
ncbi:MAG: SMP-30/gluconolactonase/LRE family protein [Phycisphaerae bacterium]|jgi:gluconolactonase